MGEPIKMLKLTHKPIIAALSLALTGAATIALANDTAPEPDPTGEAAIAHHADDSNLNWGPCPGFMPDSCRIAVLHGDPSEPNTDLFFRMAPDTTIPRHWHHSPERMILVSGEMHVDYESQEPTVLEAGSYAYGPAEKPHTAYCVEGEECMLFIAFEQPVDAFEH
jgi:quercetin dioxygenase-like cupin family protein